MGERTSAVAVARGASYLWMQTLANTTIQVVAFAFIARLISTSQMGLLAILSLIVGLAQLIAPLALPSAIARFVAEELAQGRRRNAAAVFYQSARISVTISAAIAVACFLFAPDLSAALSAEPIIFRVLAADLLLSAGLVYVIGNALIGAQRFRDYSLISIAYTAIRQTLIVGMLLLSHNFSWLVYAWLISDCVYVLMMGFIVVRVLGFPSFEFSLARLLRFSLPLLPGNAISFARSWYDRALLVPYASLSQLGIYNATLTAYNVVSRISGGIASVLYPAYAGIQSVKGKAGLEDAIRVASRYASFLVCPLALGLFATAKPALALFVGEPYADGSTALQIMTAFLALTLLGDALGDILLLLGETGRASLVTAAGVAVSLIAALVLLPRFGISGAAASRGIGTLVSFALTLSLTRHRIKLSFDREAIWKSYAASIAMAVVVLLAQQIYYSKLLLPAYAALGAAVYMTGLRLLGAIRPADVRLARQLLGKRYETPINLLSRILLVGHRRGRVQTEKP